MPTSQPLTVAVTGATGTLGRGLLPLLDAHRRVRHVVAVSSRSWSPVAEGFRRVEHRRADVRDRAALERAFRGADVVVHLAFSLYGARQSSATLAAINVGGTTNAVRAAADAGADRFIYTSSAAVYGFDRRRPQRVDETAAISPEPRHFYSRQKARAERALFDALDELPSMEWAVFRPCAVVGPNALGGAVHAIPRVVSRAAATVGSVAGSAGLRPAVPGPPVPLQFVHERDVGQALLRAVTGAATRRVYNLGGDGMVAGDDVPRLLGLRRLPVPAALSRSAIRAAGLLPPVWPALSWVDLLRHPLELDTTRARRELRWRPEFSSGAALAATRRALGL